MLVGNGERAEKWVAAGPRTEGRQGGRSGDCPRAGRRPDPWAASSGLGIFLMPSKTSLILRSAQRARLGKRRETGKE
jgi:hypothetical protein